MKIHNFLSQRGQLLIEAVLAMAIVGIILTGIVIALNYSVNNSNTSKDQNVATSFAQEGLDIIRNMKDSDYGTFSTLSGTYCLDDGSRVPVSGACNPINGKFTRKIIVNQLGQDPTNSNFQGCTQNTAVFVASVVSWTDNRCSTGVECHKVKLDSCFVDPIKAQFP